MQITQLIGLHMVFSAAGFLAASKEAGLHQSDVDLAWHQPHASPLDAFATLWHYNQVRKVAKSATSPIEACLYAT